MECVDGGFLLNETADGATASDAAVVYVSHFDQSEVPAVKVPI